MGAGGFVIENEDDFRDFLEHNHQYWDYVDEELENRFLGVSRIKCYLTDDADGLAVLRQIRAAYGDAHHRLCGGQRLGKQLARVL